MLRELSIENLAVIESAVAQFGGNFNVFTGEMNMSVGDSNGYITFILWFAVNVFNNLGYKLFKLLFAVFHKYHPS